MVDHQKDNQGIADEKDYIIKALSFNDQIRIHAIRTTQTVREAQERHQTWPTATAALGRTLSVGAIMGAMLKGEDKLTIQVRGNGPLGKIIVDANAKGEVRGYVDYPQTHLPLNAQGKLDVGGAVGHDGAIYVTKDLGLKDPYHGYSRLVNGEIGDDFTLYFVQSEQTPTAVSVGVLVNPDNSVKASGGFILQLMPGADRDLAIAIEEKLYQLPPISKLIDEGYTPEQIIETIAGDQEIKWLEKVETSFTCQCSLDRIKGSLISLGAEELKQMIKDDGQAEVICHFCNTAYVLNRDELLDLVNQLED